MSKFKISIRRSEEYDVPYIPTWFHCCFLTMVDGCSPSCCVMVVVLVALWLWLPGCSPSMVLVLLLLVALWLSLTDCNPSMVMLVTGQFAQIFDFF